MASASTSYLMTVAMRGMTRQATEGSAGAIRHAIGLHHYLRRPSVRFSSVSRSFTAQAYTPHSTPLIVMQMTTLSRTTTALAAFQTSTRRSASTQATPNASSTGDSSSSSSSSSEQPDPDEPPPKASIRERLRFLTRRYGWWALGVYLLASTFDFSLTFVAIHMMGAEHIRQLEDRVRDYLGMGKREMDDVEVAAWPVPLSVEVGGLTPEGGLANNESAARKAVERVSRQRDVAVVGNSQGPEEQAKKKGSSQSSIWTEVVLAYTIHKTLLLPFRVGITAAITPSFVKYMVRMGWARNNAAVQQAANKAKMARQAKQSSTKPASPSAPQSKDM